MQNHPYNIILASSSPYRKQLLEKLQLPFSCHSPDIDETRQPNELPETLVKRLAIEKAQAIATSLNTPNNLIISSDQIAVLDNNILTKPGNHGNAVNQLIQCSGKTVTFLTSLCILNTTTNNQSTHIEPFIVQFRDLSQQDIENYLHKDKPYDCAGSFKAESLGIALFEKMQGDDPNSLIGLPLIKLTSLLKEHGVDIL